MSTVKDLKVNTLTVLNSLELPYYSTQLPPSAEKGMLAYLASQNVVAYWTGTQWVELLTSGSGDSSWRYVADGALNTLCPNPLLPGATNPSNFVAPLPASSTEGLGKRVMFDYAKAAFRAGDTGGFPVWDNAVRGFYSVAFGTGNTASGQSTFVAGQHNLASAVGGVAAGQDHNVTSVFGTAFGRQHIISGNYSTAVGFINNISGDYSLASGQSHNVGGAYGAAFGRQHTISGAYSAVAGFSNNVSGNYSFASGRDNVINQDYSAAIGQSNQTSGVNNFAAGLSNNVSSTAGIALGRENQVSGGAASAIGFQNTVSGVYSSAIGTNHTVSGGRSAAVGEDHTISGQFSFSSGLSNHITADASASFGYSNTMNGPYSLAAGQTNTINAGADHSIALGQSSTINHAHVFMFSDGNALASAAAGEFVVGASGGTRIYSNAAHSTGVVLLANGGGWASISDINRKENLVELDSQEILSKVEQLPIYEYNYKETPANIKYRGPVAQDWHRLFPSGKPDLVIDTVDLDGITLAALKGLAAKVRALELEIQNMKK